MKKFAIRIALTAALLNMSAAQAGQFDGGYFGAKLGVNNSSATSSTGATLAPSQKTAAYLIQGGYLQGGYNLDLSAVVIGVGAYSDWNSYAKHTGGVAYGSHAYGLDAKLGLPVGKWLPYAKLGHGRSKATDDLAAVSQNGANSAVGFEYRLASHWSTVGEYKINNFSNQNGSITVKNKTVTFGLNYYFDAAPEAAPVPVPVAAPVPVPEPEPEPEPIPIPAVILKSAEPVTEVWKAFMEDKVVTIAGTNFAVGAAKLELTDGKERMKEVVEFAVDRPDSNLEVTGYTDGSGAERQNKKLSLARADAIKKYLVDAGIAADRIITKGLGSENPVGDNKTKEGRELNRRVEIRSVAKEVPAVKKVSATP